MSQHKKGALLNFKKTKSHIEKIISMLEEDKYCIDIMQQNLAVIGLLRSAHAMLMEGHLNSCFKDAMSTGNARKQNQMIKEILTVTKLFNK